MTTDSIAPRAHVRTGPSDGEITVAGELDLSTSPQLDEALDQAQASAGDVRIDLAGVTFLDSTALRVLASRREALAGSGRRLLLCTPSVQVVRVFEIAGLLDWLEPAPS